MTASSPLNPIVTARLRGCDYVLRNTQVDFTTHAPRLLAPYEVYQCIQELTAILADNPEMDTWEMCAKLRGRLCGDSITPRNRSRGYSESDAHAIVETLYANISNEVTL